MTETVLRQRLRKIRFESGTPRDQSNFENMRRLIIKLDSGRLSKVAIARILVKLKAPPARIAAAPGDNPARRSAVPWPRPSPAYHR